MRRALQVAGVEAVLVSKRAASDKEMQKWMILRAVVGDRRQPPSIGLPGRLRAKFFAGNQSCAMGKICCRDALTSFELHGVEPQSGALAASDLELAA